jgi:hypothetical protein
MRSQLSKDLGWGESFRQREHQGGRHEVDVFEGQSGSAG